MYSPVSWTTEHEKNLLFPNGTVAIVGLSVKFQSSKVSSRIVYTFHLFLTCEITFCERVQWTRCDTFYTYIMIWWLHLRKMLQNEIMARLVLGLGDRPNFIRSIWDASTYHARGGHIWSIVENTLPDYCKNVIEGPKCYCRSKSWNAQPCSIFGIYLCLWRIRCHENKIHFHFTIWKVLAYTQLALFD